MEGPPPTGGEEASLKQRRRLAEASTEGGESHVLFDHNVSLAWAGVFDTYQKGKPPLGRVTVFLKKDLIIPS